MIVRRLPSLVADRVWKEASAGRASGGLRGPPPGT